MIFSYSLKSIKSLVSYDPVCIALGLVDLVSWRQKFPRLSIFVPCMNGLTKNILEGGDCISRTVLHGLKFGIFRKFRRTTPTFFVDVSYRNL